MSLPPSGDGKADFGLELVTLQFFSLYDVKMSFPVYVTVILTNAPFSYLDKFCSYFSQIFLHNMRQTKLLVARYSNIRNFTLAELKHVRIMSDGKIKYTEKQLRLSLRTLVEHERPRMLLKDSLNHSLKQCNITAERRETTKAKRMYQYATAKDRVTQFEQNCCLLHQDTILQIATSPTAQ